MTFFCLFSAYYEPSLSPEDFGISVISRHGRKEIIMCSESVSIPRVVFQLRFAFPDKVGFSPGTPAKANSNLQVVNDLHKCLVILSNVNTRPLRRGIGSSPSRIFLIVQKRHRISTRNSGHNFDVTIHVSELHAQFFF